MIQALFFGLITVCLVYLLVMAAYQIRLGRIYLRTRGPDPEPLRQYDAAALPVVTVQLPVYNEGILARQCLTYAAALDYPRDRLQIQLLDDSDDGTTTAIAVEAVEALRREQPDLDVQYTKRDDRTGFKAGALKLGTSRARGEFLLIFDADFVIPPNFLRQTIHYFTDPSVGAVQARWDHLNRHSSPLLRLAAAKLDLHQMFEQTARSRAQLPVIFHGTAGMWRATALEDAGGWNCVSEVEDVEISIRSALRGHRIVYLDHIRVPSELPSSMTSYVRQQMRWKRGWTRVTTHYTGMLLRSPSPLRARFDLLQRIHLSWGPAAGLVITLAALPYFIVAQRYGLVVFATALYLANLVLALVMRRLEEKTLADDAGSQTPAQHESLLRFVPLGYLLNMGTAWALTQATFEGFRPGQVWEVTPKSGTTADSVGHWGTASKRLPTYVIGTLLLVPFSFVMVGFAVFGGHYLAGSFYLMLILGNLWVGLGLLRELRPHWFTWVPPRVRRAVRRAAMRV